MKKPERTANTDIPIDKEKTTDNQGLIILENSEKALSKEQQTFNRLTKRITMLQQQIASDRAWLDSMLEEYVRMKIPELRLEYAKCQYKTARILARSTELEKYGRKQFIRVAHIIVFLCEQAFENMDADEEAKDFCRRWNEECGDEDNTAMLNQMLLEYMRENFKEQTGIDMDISDFDGSPEQMEEMYKRMQAAHEQARTNNPNPLPGRKKNQKQLEREAMQEQEKNQTLKSIREIYFSLAKALHPDTETDTVQKKYKEELMKRLTVAYHQKNLTELLTLEAEWVKNESDHLESLPDEKLRLYNAVLREQVQQLENEKYRQKRHPRYAVLSYQDSGSRAAMPSRIANDKRWFLKAIDNYKNLMSSMSKPRAQKAVMEFVDNIENQLETASHNNW